MCYQFTAQEEKEITILCKHIIYYIFSFKCDFHRTSFSMWDFQPSLRQRIFSALGDFSENLKEKLAREKKKRKRLRYSQKKKVGRKSWICRTGGPRQALGFRWGLIFRLQQWTFFQLYEMVRSLPEVVRHVYIVLCLVNHRLSMYSDTAFLPISTWIVTQKCHCGKMSFHKSMFLLAFL